MKEDDKNSNKSDESANEEKTWPQILAIYIACLSSITSGVLYAWTSPFIVQITKDKENYSISEDEASYFTVIPSILMILTSYPFSRLCDVIGRKWTLMLSAIPHFLTWSLKAVAKDVSVFYAARAFAGIGDACIFSAVPMYIGEVCTPVVRGRWGGLFSFFFFLGQFFINVIGNFCDVKQTCYIGITIPIIFVVSFYFMPESPYYYVMKNRFDEAEACLKWLKHKKNVDEDFTQLKADVERQRSESGTWLDLFTINSNRRALIAGLFLRISQLLGGATAFAYYTQYIFEKAGGNLDSAISTIIYCGLCLVLNVFAMKTVDIFGRKKSYMYSLLLCSFMLLLEAIYFYIDQFYPEKDLSAVNWIPIAGMFLYITFASFGISLIPSLMLGELFSTSIKAKGLYLQTVAFGLFQIISSNIFYFLSSRVGFFSPFLFFGICASTSCVLTVYLVPETKGRTLEEIQQVLKRGKLNK
ncbi:hypothetical protein NQ315_006845 [Exocentrus adspersus]|uniref:Major facilitator superfamily (MFS) profile domain-containing protein n=1 Tax=Exocentrus adspersus TaxID=1586481 RepID=A0AAV8WCT8_9CUCU|nr:hypothetical protein NQ315_006845 [Exocentrus adspersus]